MDQEPGTGIDEERIWVSCFLLEGCERRPIDQGDLPFRPFGGARFTGCEE